jgi:hypothetical protein
MNKTTGLKTGLKDAIQKNMLEDKNVDFFV